MKKTLFRHAWLPLALLVVAIAQGQTPPPDAAAIAALVPAKTNSLNRFGASYRMGFNINVSFKNLGGFPAQTDPGAATGGVVNRRYDDGYNLVDNNNNSYGDLQATRNWGYNNASQVVDDRYIVMHSSSSPATASSNNREDDPQHGFELTYQREIARNESWSWGLEGAFGITWVSVNDSRAQTADVNRINDSFEVPAGENGFRFIPAPGHMGSDREGPLLGSEPTPPRNTTVIPGGATITGKRNFDADVYGFRLGAYADIPLSEDVQLTFSGGLAMAQVDSDFKFSQSVAISGVGSVPSSGSGSGNDFLVGGYVAGNLAVKVNKDWSLLAGVQFQNLGKYSQRESGQKAVLDLSEAVFVAVGASYSF